MIQALDEFGKLQDEYVGARPGALVLDPEGWFHLVECALTGGGIDLQDAHTPAAMLNLKVKDMQKGTFVGKALPISTFLC